MLGTKNQWKGVWRKFKQKIYQKLIQDWKLSWKTLNRFFSYTFTVPCIVNVYVNNTLAQDKISCESSTEEWSLIVYKLTARIVSKTGITFVEMSSLNPWSNNNMAV